MHKIYVNKRVSGEAPREAARAAGYSDQTKITDIEKAGGPVDSLIKKALAKKGIDDDFLANEYVDGIGAAKERGARDKDLNAHAQYLKQLGYLLGHGAKQPSVPQVAVQINNNTSVPGKPQEIDPSRIAETLQRVEAILGMVEEELGQRESAGVPDGDSPEPGRGEILAEAEPCEGVVPPSPDGEEIGGGGQP